MNENNNQPNNQPSNNQPANPQNPQNPQGGNQPQNQPANPSPDSYFYGEDEMPKSNNLDLEGDYDDSEKVVKAIEQTNQNLVNLQKQMAREQEFSSFINSDEGKKFAKHADTIRKFMNDPRNAHIKVKGLAHIVAGDDLMKLGAETRNNADVNASLDRTGGGQPRVVPANDNIPDVSEIPVGDPSMEDMIQKAKAGHFVPQN